MASSAAIRRSRHKKKGLGGAPKRRTPPGWLANDRRATVDLRSYGTNKAYGQITHTVQQRITAQQRITTQQRFTAQQRIRPKQRVQIRTASKSEFHPQGILLALRPCMGCLGCPFQVIRLDLLPIPTGQDGDPGPTGPKASLCIACAKTVQQSHDKGKKDAQIVGSLASLSYLCSNFAAHP